MLYKFAGSLDFCGYKSPVVYVSDFRYAVAPKAFLIQNSWSLDLFVQDPARLDSW